MALSDILVNMIIEGIRGPQKSNITLQIILCTGIAAIISSIVNKHLSTLTTNPIIVLIVLITLLASFTLLYISSVKRLEEVVNKVLNSAVGNFQQVFKVIEFIDSVLCEGRSMLDDITETLSKKEMIKLISTGIFFLGFLTTIIIILDNIFQNISNIPLLTRLDTYGGTLLIALAITLVITTKPIPKTISARGEEFSDLASELTELYVLENTARKYTKLNYIILTSLSIAKLLSPPKINTPKFSSWINTIVFTKEFANLIRNLAEKELIKPVGEISLDDLLKKDVENLEQIPFLRYHPPEVLFKKLIKGGEAKSKGARFHILSPTKEKVGFLAMIPWKGCVIKKRLRKLGKEYRIVVESIESRRLYTILVTGLDEYVNYMKIRIMLAAPTATGENIICKAD